MCPRLTNIIITIITNISNISNIANIAATSKHKARTVGPRIDCHPGEEQQKHDVEHHLKAVRLMECCVCVCGVYVSLL